MFSERLEFSFYSIFSVVGEEIAIMRYKKKIDKFTEKLNSKCTGYHLYALR